MQYLIGCLLALVALTAHADKWLEVQNKTGGKILLTSAECPGKASMRRMMSTAPNNPTMFGCWTMMAEIIHVVYDDGTAYTYPLDAFQYIDTDKSNRKPM
jgi:hypothetical protein